MKCQYPETKCQYPDPSKSTCRNRAVVWNDRSEWACGRHQRWLARKRDAKRAAA